MVARQEEEDPGPRARQEAVTVGDSIVVDPRIPEKIRTRKMRRALQTREKSDRCFTSG